MRFQALPDPALFCVDGRKVISLARYRRLIDYDWRYHTQAVDSWDRYDAFIRTLPSDGKLVSVGDIMNESIEDTAERLDELEDQLFGMITFRSLGSHFEICCTDIRDAMFLKLKFGLRSAHGAHRTILYD